MPINFQNNIKFDMKNYDEIQSGIKTEEKWKIIEKEKKQFYLSFGPDSCAGICK